MDAGSSEHPWFTRSSSAYAAHQKYPSRRSKRENLTITLENGPDNTLTINPVTAPLENVSRWLTTAQITYGIVIEDLQFTLAGNEEITLKHLSFREQQ